MNHDQKLHDTTQKIAGEIDAHLRPFATNPADGVNVSLVLLREIFGMDIRAGSEFNKLDDASVEALLQEAKVCLRTLNVLAENGCLRATAR